jgi:hypothetical protein
VLLSQLVSSAMSTAPMFLHEEQYGSVLADVMAEQQ